MAYSMTGWGTYKAKKFTINIKGLNSKYKEVFLHMPTEFFSLEANVHRLISDAVNRGKVDVYINIDKAKIKKRITVNEELYKSAYAALKKLLAKTGEKHVPVEVIFQSVEGIVSEDLSLDADFAWEQVKPVIEKAIKDFVKMKQAEAERLLEDIAKRVDVVEKEAENIKKLFETYKVSYTIKIKNKIEELLRKSEEKKEGFIAAQVVEVVEKFDITEELVRLSSHVKQIRALYKEKIVGRKLDFIAQEIYREANTLTNKLGSPEISACAIAIKETTEKIREQAANLE